MTLAKQELPTYTYQDYLSWKGDWELIRGIPFAMSPSPKGNHQFILSSLLAQIYGNLAKCLDCHVYAELDWIVSETTVLRPDIFVFCGHRINEYLEVAPHFIAEILSPKTATKDKGLKLRIYQEQKVPYYIIVEPKNETVTIYELEGDSYLKVGTITTENHTFNLPNCSFKLNFSLIW